MSKMMREEEMGCREKVGVKRITLKTTRQTLALSTLWHSWANMHWNHYFKMMALNNILMLFKLWQTMYFHDEKPTCNLEAIRGCLAAYRRNLVEEFPTGRAPSTGRACVFLELERAAWRVALAQQVARSAQRVTCRQSIQICPILFKSIFSISLRHNED